MFDITVTVSGPGGIVNREVEIIRRALLEANCSVQVENAHPDDSDISGQYKPRNIPTGGVKSHVQLIVEHLPWGG